MKVVILCFLFLNTSYHIYSQETKDFLFIGDSFFKQYSLPEKFKNNFEHTFGFKILVDSSLHNGYNFSRQIESNEALHEMLKTTDYKCIIIQCSRLLLPGSTSQISDAIVQLIQRAPATNKIIVVPMEECAYFPRYECTRTPNKVKCNIYKDCGMIEDTVNAVSHRLVLEFDNLEILPFFQLKEKIKYLNFPLKDDQYWHPTDELQEVLARFLVFWLAGSEGFNDENFDEIRLTSNFKSITKEMMNNIMGQFLVLYKLKYTHD